MFAKDELTDVAVNDGEVDFSFKIKNKSAKIEDWINKKATDGNMMRFGSDKESKMQINTTQMGWAIIAAYVSDLNHPDLANQNIIWNNLSKDQRFDMIRGEYPKADGNGWDDDFCSLILKKIKEVQDKKKQHSKQ